MINREIDRDIDKETAAAYALSRIYCFEPRIPKTIVEHLGSASAIFELDKEGLDTALGPFNKHRDAIRGKSLEQWAEELRKAIPQKWQYIPYFDETFPKALWECEDSPLGLFFQGFTCPKYVFARPCISIVGTRDMSSYGAQWCRKLPQALSQTKQRPTIVSGLAFGVDISAQMAAMDFGLPTIGVLATGAGIIYPRQHEFYASKIVERENCAIITEYPPDNNTATTSFLCRNRIIAGLSSATILVESRLKGGGITTANIASSYSRDVFAVPGRCDDARSQGCNMLIHNRVAEPIFDCESFIKAINFKLLPKADRDRAIVSGMTKVDGKMSEKMTQLVLAIRKNRDITAPELAQMTGFPLEDVLSGAVILENDGIIQSDILGRYSIKIN